METEIVFLMEMEVIKVNQVQSLKRENRKIIYIHDTLSCKKVTIGWMTSKNKNKEKYFRVVVY